MWQQTTRGLTQARRFRLQHYLILFRSINYEHCWQTCIGAANHKYVVLLLQLST